MTQQNVHRILKSDYLKLLLILVLAFYLAFIPHSSYPYPMHLDEWMHMACSNEIIEEASTVGLTDPFSGQGIHGNQIFEVGFHLLWAIFHQISGISWLTIFRYFPGIIFMIAVLSVYVLGRRQGFGWEAALFTCLIPTTVGILGPGFLVPVAMGLVCIPLSLFVAFNFGTIRSYLVLFFFVLFLVSLHPPSAICLVVILIPYILLNVRGNFKHSVGVTLAIVIPFVAPLPWIFGELLPAAKSLLSPEVVPTYVDLPQILPTYGYLPVLLCLLGTFLLTIRGGKRSYGLVLGLLALLVMLATFFTFHYGQIHVYLRGLMPMMLMMSIVAGAGLAWVKNLKLSAKLSAQLRVPLITNNIGNVLCLALIIVTLVTCIPVRQNIPYYHMIDDADYQAFVWIRDNIDESYEKAVLDPRKAVAFSAITGKYTYAQIFGTPTPNSRQAYNFLQEGCRDTILLKENGISIVYTQGECDNPDLVNVRDNVYLLKETGASE